MLDAVPWPHGKNWTFVDVSAILSSAVGWIRFLQTIGGTEKQARALLKDLSRE